MSLRRLRSTLPPSYASLPAANTGPAAASLSRLVSHFATLKRALRHLAKGDVQEVPCRQIRVSRTRACGRRSRSRLPRRAGTLAEEADARPLEVIPALRPGGSQAARVVAVEACRRG